VCIPDRTEPHAARYLVRATVERKRAILMGRPRWIPRVGATLSDQEVATVRAIADGRTAREVAAELDMSVCTIRTLLERLCIKTGCRGRVELTRWAVATGLVPLTWVPREASGRG